MLKIEEFLELARDRRTVRGYKKKEVPRECIEKMLEAARWAPSGGNSQPWEFVIITDSEMRRRIYDLYVKTSEEKREMELAVRGELGGGTSPRGFRNAPVFILVLGDRRVNQAFPIRTQLDKGEQHFITGLASATLMIHLAATAMGLGSQWVSDTASPYMATILKSWLGIPQHLKVYDMLAIGYPVKQPQAPPRRAAEEVAHWDRYDPGRERNDADILEFLMQQTRLGKFGSWAAMAAEESDKR